MRNFLLNLAGSLIELLLRRQPKKEDPKKEQPVVVKP